MKKKVTESKDLHKRYIGIDNGVTGSIVVVGGEIIFALTPEKKEQDYTKKKQNISRVNAPELISMINEYTREDVPVLVLIERPLVNPSSDSRFKTKHKNHSCYQHQDSRDT